MDSASQPLLLKDEHLGALPGAPVSSSPFGFISNEDAQRTRNILNQAWYRAYVMAMPSKVAPFIEGAVEAERITKSALRKVEHQAILQFGRRNEKYPDCEECLWSSVFGGPRHDAGAYCESGKRPHCSCPNCY